MPEPVEYALLQVHAIRDSPSDSICFQRSVNSLMTAVLGRFSSLNSLWLDPQLDPPNGQRADPKAP